LTRCTSRCTGKSSVVANDDDEPDEIDSGYDFGSVLYYYTWESAWKECERLSKMNEAGHFASKEDIRVS
jgi:hypothetical protein